MNQTRVTADETPDIGLLEPVLAASGIAPAGTFVIGTVKGDIHDIGKNLVGMMLRGAGFADLWGHLLALLGIGTIGPGGLAPRVVLSGAAGD